MSRIERHTPVALSDLPAPKASDRHAVQDIHILSDLKGFDEHKLYLRYAKLQHMMAMAAVTSIEMTGELYGRNMNIQKGYAAQNVVTRIIDGVSVTSTKDSQLFDRYSTRTLRIEFYDSHTLAHIRHQLDHAELGIFSNQKKRTMAADMNASGVVAAYVGNAIFEGLRRAFDDRYDNMLVSERVVGMGMVANNPPAALHQLDEADIPVVFAYKDITRGESLPQFEPQPYNALTREIVRNSQNISHE